MFDSLKFDNDDDALRKGEKWMLIIANILLIIGWTLTDYETTTKYFGTVDPVFVGWVAANVLFATVSLVRSRMALVSYTDVSSNYATTVTDQAPIPTTFKPQMIGATAAKEVKTTIYDENHTFVKGISVPPMSYKRTILSCPATHIDVLPWGNLLKCKVKRYVGIDHMALPPHLTEDWGRQDPSILRFKFGQTQVYHGDEVDKSVAHYNAEGVDIEIGKDADGKPIMEKCHWVRGGEFVTPHDLSKEESYNRQIHQSMTQIERIIQEYEELTGLPYTFDAGESSDGGADNGV